MAADQLNEDLAAREIDVAFSFLDRDQSLATAIADRLRDRMRVFNYPERQKDLVGKDGVAVLSSVFGTRGKVVVVLYREDWGTTKWTAVEKDAIVGRGFDQATWDFLILIPLDGSAKLPEWLPRQHIWLHYERFGA